MLSRLRFYWVVAAGGAVLMALEILSSRVLAPHFGNSVYVWGSIISVFLAALSLGYLWGGRLADRDPSLAALGRLLVLAAGCQTLLLLAGSRLTAWLGEVTGGTPAGTLLATAVLFGPASVLLATVSPYAVRLAARDLGGLGGLGNTAGRLYALSTLGSLAGTLGCTFGLIPFLELRQIVGLLTAATAATAGVALAGAVRRALPAAGLAVLLLAVAIPSIFLPARLRGDLIYERVTPYQTLQVRERDGVRSLESDRIRQAAVRRSDGETALLYPRYAAAAWLVKPDIRRVLVIGLGGGSVGSYLQRRIPGLAVDDVDIDPVVPEVARRFLGFREGPGTRVTVADGRNFLRGSAARWDFIYGDAYIGLSVPFHLTTIQFLDEVKRHLTPGGVFGLNLSAGLSDPFSQAMYRTVRERFRSVYLLSVRGASNSLVLAADAPELTTADLVARGRELDRRARFDPPLAAVATHRQAVNFAAGSVPILSDEFAPVDRLIRLGATASGSTGSRRPSPGGHP
jgi:spermidine synthase